jgi:hypothetical protein
MAQQILLGFMLGVLALLGGSIGLFSCDDKKTDHSKEANPAPVSSLPQEPSMRSPHAEGQVLAGRDLGMVVTGSGAENEARSLDVLEHQLLSFLPQLQEVYDHERAEDPSLMGSLDVQITIESNGAVSDLRFPIKRVSGEKLTTAVYDRMRGWIFFPAESPVDFRYRLFFVPPSMEAASIIMWEKHLAGRMVIERGEERTVLPTRTATAVTTEQSPPVEDNASVKKDSLPEAQQESQEVASAKEASPGKSEREASGLLPPHEKKSPPKFVPTWYEVTRPSVLYGTPDVSAEIVTRLSPGQRVLVVKVVDKEWLEVQSVKGRRPGFLPRETARKERRGRASR